MKKKTIYVATNMFSIEFAANHLSFFSENLDFILTFEGRVQPKCTAEVYQGTGT